MVDQWEMVKVPHFDGERHVSSLEFVPIRFYKETPNDGGSLCANGLWSIASTSPELPNVRRSGNILGEEWLIKKL